MVIVNQNKLECCLGPSTKLVNVRKRRGNRTVLYSKTNGDFGNEAVGENYSKQLELIAPQFDYKKAYQRTKYLVNSAYAKLKNLPLLGQGDCPCKRSISLVNCSSANTRFSDTFVKKVNGQNMGCYYQANVDYCPRNFDRNFDCERDYLNYEKCVRKCMDKKKKKKCCWCCRRKKKKKRCTNRPEDCFCRGPNMMDKIRSCWCDSPPGGNYVPCGNMDGCAFQNCPGICECGQGQRYGQGQQGKRRHSGDKGDRGERPTSGKGSQGGGGMACEFDDCCCCCPCRKQPMNSELVKCQCVQTEPFKKRCCRCCRNRCGICSSHLGQACNANTYKCSNAGQQEQSGCGCGAGGGGSPRGGQNSPRIVICKSAGTQHSQSNNEQCFYETPREKEHRLKKESKSNTKLSKKSPKVMFSTIKSPLFMNQAFSSPVTGKVYNISPNAKPTSNNLSSSFLLKRRANLSQPWYSPMQPLQLPSMDFSFTRKSKNSSMDPMCESILRRDGMSGNQCPPPDCSFADSRLARELLFDMDHLMPRKCPPKSFDPCNFECFERQLCDFKKSPCDRDDRNKEMTIAEASRVVNRYLNDINTSAESPKARASDGFISPIKDYLQEITKEYEKESKGANEDAKRIKSDSLIFNFDKEDVVSKKGSSTCPDPKGSVSSQFLEMFADSGLGTRKSSPKILSSLSDIYKNDS